MDRSISRFGDLVIERRIEITKSRDHQFPPILAHYTRLGVPSRAVDLFSQMRAALVAAGEVRRVGQHRIVYQPDFPTGLMDDVEILDHLQVAAERDAVVLQISGKNV